MTVVNPKSISGINSITTGSGSDNLLTIHTSDASSTERVRINSSGDVIVGSGITVSPDGDIFATGVTTATTFVGALTGNVTGNATGLSGTPNISAGTIAGSTGTFTGDVDIADKIVHTGDTDTAIRFSAADTIQLETGGAARFTLSSGNIVQQSGTLSIKNATGDSSGLKLSQESGDESRIFNHYSGALTFGTANTERARITSDGKMGLGIASPTGQFAVSDGTRIAEINPHSSGTFIGNRSNHDVLFQVNAATKAKIDTNGHLTIIDGDLVIGTSGHGISFAADANASGNTSELLHDYEEGTWSVTSFNYDYDGNQAQRGHYIKVGRVVHAFFRVKFHTQTNYTGQHLRFTGLPFTSASGSPYDLNVCGIGHGYGTVDFFRVYVQPGSTYAYWYTSTGNNFNNSTSLNNADVRGCITYTASS